MSDSVRHRLWSALGQDGPPRFRLARPGELRTSIFLRTGENPDCSRLQSLPELERVAIVEPGLLSLTLSDRALWSELTRAWPSLGGGQPVVSGPQGRANLVANALKALGRNDTVRVGPCDWDSGPLREQVAILLVAPERPIRSLSVDSADTLLYASLRLARLPAAQAIDLVLDSTERDLAGRLEEYRWLRLRAQPFSLLKFLLDLAHRFHSYYEQNRLLESPGALALCYGLRGLFEQAGQDLGLPRPEFG